MDAMDAGRAISLLTTAFPTYPVDEATSQLYVQALTDSRHDALVAFAVVHDWITRQLLFPKIAELLDACEGESKRRAAKARAISAAQKAPMPPGMVACKNCRDTTFEEYTDDKNRLSVIPCRDCQPTRHVDWRDGHCYSGHDFKHCDWALCVERADRGLKVGARAVKADDAVSPNLVEVF